MGKVTRHTITDKQFTEILYYFDMYKKMLGKLPENKLQELGFAKKAVLRKHTNTVNTLWTELDNI